MAKKVNKQDNKPLKLGPEDVVALKATLRPGGRPRGSRNKIGREIRDLAKRYTLRCVRAAWKLAKSADTQDTQLKAIQMLLAYGHARPVDRQEVSGAGGTPLHPPMPDREVARRIALLLTRPGSGGEGVVAELIGTAGSDGTPARRSVGGGAAVGETPAPSGASASSPNRSNGAGDPRGGRKDRADDTGDPNPTQSENFSKDAKPTEPQPGQAARCAGFIIRCTEASRPGLPNQYQILDGSGQLQSMAVNGWSDALRWIKARVGDDADMSIDIIRPAPTAEPIRPDQRQFAVGGPDIEVLRGYEDRKL